VIQSYLLLQQLSNINIFTGFSPFVLYSSFLLFPH